MGPTYPQLDPEEQAWSKAGLALSPAEIAPLLEELVRFPDDARLRTMLACVHGPRASTCGGAAEIVPHFEWFLARRPGSRTMTVLCCRLSQVTDPAIRDRVDALVAPFVEAATSPIELGNIAAYFSVVEPDRAAALLRRARDHDPESSMEWGERIREVGSYDDVLGVRGRAATERALGCALPGNPAALTPEQAAKLECRLKEVPEDATARLFLVRWYFQQSLKAGQLDVTAQDPILRFREHVGWFVDHAPYSKEAGEASSEMHRRLDPDGFADIAARWERQLLVHHDNPTVLRNAAEFFALNDKAHALILLEQAREIEPNEPEWSRRIAQQLALQARDDDAEEVRLERAQRIYEELERASTNAVQADDGHNTSRAFRRSSITESFNLPQLARAALAAGRTVRAGEIAQRLLALQAPHILGCAHEANLVLGLVALRHGDAAKAGEYLRTAAHEPFPFRAGRRKRMQLAKELYDVGERDAVRTYLEADLQDADKVARRVDEKDEGNLESFSGRAQVASWLQALREGRRPDFPAERL